VRAAAMRRILASTGRNTVAIEAPCHRGHDVIDTRKRCTTNIVEYGMFATNSGCGGKGTLERCGCLQSQLGRQEALDVSKTKMHACGLSICQDYSWKELP
jgi:hypothetical protein